jgi:GMP synthase-like glutamine amidotransferase
MSNLKNKKILVVNDHAPSHFKPFEHLGLGYTRNTDELKRNPDSIALVVFTGGSDVSAELYGKSEHPSTHASPARDMEEVEVYGIAFEAGIPMSGICRGAQFLCAMAGGSVIQDVTGHNGGEHDILACYPDGSSRVISVTSAHHQMQYPFDLPDEHYELLAWGTEARSRHYSLDAERTTPVREASTLLRTEVDVVLYPGIKALAAQYHPEWMREDTDGFVYFRELVDHHLVPLMEERYQDDRQREETSKTAG